MENSGKVNSAHHQVVDKKTLGKNLKINAHSKTESEIAEGIEFKDKSGKAFMLCVQWHPERMIGKEESAFSQNIKKNFLEEIRRSKVKKIEIINPATEEIITSVNEDDAESIAKKFELLKKAQPSWAETPVNKRVECIKKFVALLDKHKDELAKTLTDEMGKPLQQSYNELNGAKTKIQFFIDNSEKWLEEEWITTKAQQKKKLFMSRLV